MANDHHPVIVDGVMVFVLEMRKLRRCESAL